MLTRAKNYLLEQLDKMTAWIGIIGIVLLSLGFTNLLYLLFIALIIFPESHFSSIFKKWTSEIRELDK